eukprot:TRINITY_DN3302_c0_g4_i1.p1 TRINITY_DN3302_c0_g4~~TRINITY_DN3302_c0_g4_i1.p1  ORF type:complete len:203 (-),score=48.73 TRINITY_DN3302_c0_g4_i1:19-579(-)
MAEPNVNTVTNTTEQSIDTNSNQPSNVTQPLEKELTPEEEAAQKAEEKRKRHEKRQAEAQKRETDLVYSTQTLFRTLSDYLRGELLATSEDYKLLENMNNVTKEKYVEMTEMAVKLGEQMTLLQQKYKSFQPYLEKIDEIDTSVNELEKTVVLLDEYTLRLEEKFKHLKQIGRLPYKKSNTMSNVQ